MSRGEEQHNSLELLETSHSLFLYLDFQIWDSQPDYTVKAAWHLAKKNLTTLGWVGPVNHFQFHNIQPPVAGGELRRCRVFGPDPLGDVASHWNQCNLNKCGKHLDLSVQAALNYCVEDYNLILPGKSSINNSCCLGWNMVIVILLFLFWF